MTTEYDIYLMPGLGLNHHIFDQLSFRSGNVYYLNWLEPQVDESLSSYTRRLSQMINKGRNPLVLIGHSFGGVLVQELHRLIQADKLVLISTIHSPQELPFQLRLLKYTRLHRLIRTDVLKCSVRLWGGKHGYDTPELKALFRQSAGQLSHYYFRWAVEQIVCWTTVPTPCTVLRIHGTADKTFPFQRIGGASAIEKGDHLAVYKHGPLISHLIDGFLQSPNNR
jgi:pimeloyl-ACP methyl ester carboxylesterase